METDDPAKRPTAQQVLSHPFYWSPGRKIEHCKAALEGALSDESGEQVRSESPPLSCTFYARFFSETLKTMHDCGFNAGTPV